MLRTRIIVALIFLPVFAWLIFLDNPWPLFILVFAAIAIAMVEFGKLIQNRDIPFRWWVSIPSVFALCMTAAFSRSLPGQWPINAIASFWFIGIAAMMLLGIREIFTDFREKSGFATIGAGFMPIIAVGGIGTFLFLLRLLPHGSYWWIILFGFNWIYDAGALFCGKYFGRTPLAPTISPAKTVEGMIGGLLINIIVAFIVYVVWFPRTVGFSLVGFVSLGVVLGLLSQAGDLVESMVKRWSGTKDASSIIPGHGGLLDKIDNLCFTAPLMYCIAWWLTT